MGWAGTNWRNGVLINGRRYQRMKVLKLMDYDSSYDEDIYTRYL